MKLVQEFVLFCLVFLIHVPEGWCEDFPQCKDLPAGSFISGTQGCKSYIYCDDDDSYEGFCPSSLMFNSKEGSCAPADEVDCVDSETIATTTATTTTTMATTTTTTSSTAPTTIQVTTSAPVDMSNEDNGGQQEYVDEEPAPPDDNNPVVSSSVPVTAVITTYTPPVKPVQACPANDKLDEVIFLPSDESCNEYFVCYHGTPIPMHCADHLYFDQLTSKCELPERVNCKIGSVTTANPRKECTSNLFDYFPYPMNCNYFYKCMNGFLSLQQCPIGFGWSEDMKLCLKLEQGRCPVRVADLHQSQVLLNSVFYQ